MNEPGTLKPLTVAVLVAEQQDARYVRWKHFDRVLRRLEEIHEMTQHVRQRQAREDLALEAVLLPKTRESIERRWKEAQAEIDAQRKPHPVARVIIPIPARREASGR